MRKVCINGCVKRRVRECVGVCVFEVREDVMRVMMRAIACSATA